MADSILNHKRTCIKCGSDERNSNGDCGPCQKLCSTAWKARNKLKIANSGEPVFYTYIHRRADDKKVFYIGKGKGDRCKSERNRNAHWHRIVSKHGLLVEIVARWESEDDAFAHEKLLIASHRKEGVELCNYTDGGDGPSGYKHTDETRSKLSSMQIGKIISPEHRLKLSIAGKGRIVSSDAREKISQAQKGRKHSAERNKRNSESRIGKPLKDGVGAKISASNMGRIVSAETRAKISSSHIGMKPSKEACEKISRANKGLIRSPEFKAKIVAALTGRVCSAETRAKIAESNRGKVISVECREKISSSLSGRRHSAEMIKKLTAIARSPERRAQHSAAMKGRPWSDARRAAQNILKE